MKRYSVAGAPGIIAVGIACGVLIACGGDRGGTGDSAATGAGASAAAATASTDSGTTAASATMSDANIVALIGVINAGEIDEGQAASRRATAVGVKRYARDMVTDHRAMQKAIDSLSTAKNVVPQPSASADSLRDAMKAGPIGWLSYAARPSTRRT